MEIHAFLPNRPKTEGKGKEFHCHERINKRVFLPLWTDSSPYAFRWDRDRGRGRIPAFFAARKRSSSMRY
jgi:hypothetical protein